MSAATVTLVPTGVANLASVAAAFRRVDQQVVTARGPDDIEAASHLVLPGVGAFGAGMAALHETSAVAALRARIAADRPTLAICLGLQMLSEGSEESPDVRGLGVIPGTATRFPESVRVPQFGWNRVTPDAEAGLVQPGHAYFANTYRLTASPPGWSTALADHGGPFVAALQRGAVLACQFHPELSGAWGLDLLRRWLDKDARRTHTCSPDA